MVLSFVLENVCITILTADLFMNDPCKRNYTNEEETDTHVLRLFVCCYYIRLCFEIP